MPRITQQKYTSKRRFFGSCLETITTRRRRRAGIAMCAMSAVALNGDVRAHARAPSPRRALAPASRSVAAPPPPNVRWAHGICRAHPHASRRAKAKRAPDAAHPKHKYSVDERLAYKGIDIERMRAGEEFEADAKVAFASEVPRGEDVCEHVAMLAMRQELEQWPAQKTDAWVFARASCLTASDVGAVLGIDRHRDAEAVLKMKTRARAAENDLKQSMLAGEFASVSASASKKKKDKKYGHPATRHGDAFEAEALAHYEAVNDTKCLHFGMKTHDSYYWLGASPDGIHPAGRVVEIKCPFTRPVLSNGKRMLEHYAQIQTLMEVFDCEFCDFVQYKPAGRGKGRSGNMDAPLYVCETVPRDREWFAKHFETLLEFSRSLPSPA